MKSFIYKIIIAAVAIILVFKLTIGKEISQINQKINYFSTSDGRKSIINSLKKEMKKATDKENYLDEEERILINDFIKKIKKELELNN
ncbi:hypothetical protein N9M72_00440 [Candidatus Pelagibacter bacterium]|nr:hypothetical protein [Candidatus Pelagibacter bacterium]MDA8772415.1 hypothetical protein [Candidatus Pelagibacter bacterium]